MRGKPKEYVSHPRYGDTPRYTDVDPDPKSAETHFHWNTRFSLNESREYWLDWGYEPEEIDRAGRAIPGTAVEADLDLQTPATIPVTHYFDIERRCRDCHRWFIFFADQQKHWYEELEFPLEADCLDCTSAAKNGTGSKTCGFGTRNSPRRKP